MHEFSDLASSSTSFTLRSLDDLLEKEFSSLQSGASTKSIKNIQSANFSKVIFAIGLFSLLESMVLYESSVEKVKKNLDQDLFNTWHLYYLAINVLKHGEGKSYDELVSKKLDGVILPFKVKLPNEEFFDEGEVSEINILIDVDNDFVLGCLEIVELVSTAFKIQPK